jgi:hypothetical protein
LSHLPRDHDPEERLRHLTIAARLWPDPNADTALYFRLLALASALRRGGIRLAASLIGGWPLRPSPAFAARATPPIARRVRRRLNGRRGHGAPQRGRFAELG